MQVFFDGSEIIPDNGRERHTHRLHSWGFVINHDDVSHEHHGARLDTTKVKGMHEYIALVEAILVIRDMGLDPISAVYHTDSDQIPHIATMLYESNYIGSARKAAAINTVQRLCKACYDEEIYELVMRCLMTARFVWVKAHRKHVYHSRCDYLAKYANRKIREIAMQFLHFEDWLFEGLKQYTNEGVEYDWYPPFVRSI